MQSHTKTFYEHIRELQLRLLFAGAALVLGGIVGYVYHKQLARFLQQPLNDNLYYTSPAGALNYVLKISLLVGIAFALPVFIYNVVSFVQPAVHKHVARKNVKIVTLLSVILAAAGATFAYYIVVPMSLHFFGEFKSDSLQSLISAEDYLGFIINCLITFILVFQIPLLLLFFDRIKPIPPKKLLKYERHIIVGSLVFALVLPFTYDPLTQFLIALPVIVLYNLSIVMILYVHWARKRAGRKIEKRDREINVAVAAEPVAEPLAELLDEPLPELAAAPLPAPTPVPAAIVAPAKPALPRTRRPIGDMAFGRQNLLDLAPKRQPVIIEQPQSVIDPIFG